jgi:hypothetical protein
MATIYEPKFLQPYNSCIDMTSNQNFTAVMQGAQITHYQLRIYNNSTNALLYDSTKLALSPVLYNNDTLTIVVPSGSAGTTRELKWTLAVWNGSETIVSREKYFTNYQLPTVSLVSATLNEQSYEFVATYTQAQSLSVKKFKFTLYDSNNLEIDNSDWQFNGSVLWTFSGFIDGNTYYVKCEVYDINNVYATSGLVLYDVSYTQPSVNIKPTLLNLTEVSGIEVSWSGIYDNIGASTGTVEYVADYTPSQLYALYIHSNSTAYWTDLKIAEDFTDSFIWRPYTVGFTGKIAKHENTISGKYYEFGYDGEKFYYDINGIITYTIPIELTADMLNMIVLTPTKVSIKVGSIYYGWNEYSGNTWLELNSITWGTMLQK